MRLLREEGSTRVRAGLRGLLPAVVTLVLFVAGLAALARVVGSGTGALAPRRAVVARLALFALYLVMLVVAVRLASALERRPLPGLAVDRRWLRHAAAGTACSGAGILLSLGWGVARGFRAVDPTGAISGPGGPAYAAVAVATFLLYLLVGNVYEEVVYRAVMLRTFAAGLAARGHSPAWSVVPATAGSLVLFGLYHLPLRGDPVVVVDAALVGVTFALAYLLGGLGLAVGVHFGRATLELLTGVSMLGVEVPAVVAFTRDTVAANLEVRLLELALVCLFVLAWSYRVDGELRLAEAVSLADGRESTGR